VSTPPNPGSQKSPLLIDAKPFIAPPAPATPPNPASAPALKTDVDTDIDNTDSIPAASPYLQTYTPTHLRTALRAQLLTVFSRAHIWPGLRRKLSDELLAEDGPGWLRQSLGWICCAVRRFPRMELGAVVYPALRDRLPVDAEFLPPPELDFDHALAWAECGGQPTPDYTNAAPDDGPSAVAYTPTHLHTYAPTHPALPSRPAVPSRPQPHTPLHTYTPTDLHTALWLSAQSRLQAEMPGPALADWLRGARLDPLGPGRYRLSVPTPQARDWLANRLRQRLVASLSAVAGQAIELDIEVDQQQKTPTEGGQLG
jgi:hypothetical protein